jgi:hypothetical protein
VKLFQLALEGVNVRGGEFVGGRPQGPNSVQHIQRPAAFLGFDFAERFDFAELRPHFFGGNDYNSLAPRLSGERAGERGFDVRLLTPTLSSFGEERENLFCGTFTQGSRCAPTLG